MTIPAELFTLLLCAGSLIFVVIAGILMFFSFAAIRYRRTKYQDSTVIYRWIFIPVLLPLRVCYEIARLGLRLLRLLLFLVVGVAAMVISPFYFLLIRPMSDYNSRLRQAMNSFERFVELFRNEIRLGQWLMFYPPEAINSDIEIIRRPPFGGSNRPQRPPSAQSTETVERTGTGGT